MQIRFVVAVIAAQLACTAGPAPKEDAGSPDAGRGCGGSAQACCLTGASCDPGFKCESAKCVAFTPTDVGHSCTESNDCEEDICLPLVNNTSVCSQSCANDSGCVAGWSCLPWAGFSTSICQCTPSAEVCDGKDNDCNGVVDDTFAVQQDCIDAKGANWICSEGSCQCPSLCNGQCVGFSYSLEHCGACNNACEATSPATAACESGHCVVTLATDQKLPLTLAAAGNKLYWATRGQLLNVPKAGGSTSTMRTVTQTNIPSDYSFFSNGALLFWQGEGSILNIPTNGSAHVPLYSGNVGRPVASDTHLVWSTLADDAVVKLPIQGGSLSTVASGWTTDASSVTTDATHAYWVQYDASHSGNGTLVKAPLSGGAIETLCSSNFYPRPMAFNGSVYWGNGGGLMRVPITGGAVVTVTDLEVEANEDMAVNSKGLYFISDYDIIMVPREGGSVQTLAREGWGNISIMRIAADEDGVYWVNAKVTTGDVRRVKQ